MTTIIGADEFGTIARWVDAEIGIDTLVYLTGCCEAAVTGVSITADYPAGVACKACYRAVSTALLTTPAYPAS